MKHDIGFIGCGNMGGALAKAAANAVSPSCILIADKDEKKAAEFATALGAGHGNSLAVAFECKYIFLGVKPQVLPEMLSEIKEALLARNDRFLLVSMAAGVSAEKIQSIVGDCPIIRIMPNIPVSVGEGMILYCTKGDVTENELNVFLNFMSKAGKLAPLDEKLIDAGSAVSGCGPAFVSLFIEALADGGVQCGLPRDKAMLLAAQTLLGTAEYIIKTETHPAVLKDAVCSPGGTTIVGVHALEEGGLRSAVANAVISAYNKTLDLGK